MKGRTAHLGMRVAVWTKHLLARCKLTSAIRVSGLTSRACGATSFLRVASACRAVPIENGSGT